jgi:hypothetical protein
LFFSLRLLCEADKVFPFELHRLVQLLVCDLEVFSAQIEVISAAFSGGHFAESFPMVVVAALRWGL